MMPQVLRIVTVLPELLDLHADSANASVLHSRAGWEGIPVRLDAMGIGDDVPAARPDLILVGSGADDDLEPTARELTEFGTAIRDWVEAGSFLLAVGTGWKLLADRVEIAPDEFIAGRGVFTGTAHLLTEHTSGELVATSANGTLVGFENHSHGYSLGDGEEPLGIIAEGIGNGDRREGAVRGNAIGTHLHGPILAKNPWMADELLDRLLLSRYGTRFLPKSDQARRADEYSRRIRENR